MICTRCNGKKEIETYMPQKDENGKYFILVISCDFCEGTGEITEEDVIRQKNAENKYQERIEREVNLRDEAKRLGIGTVELSRRERGVRPWAKEPTIKRKYI